MAIRTTVKLFFILCLAGGCSFKAPHNNPLDPESPAYTGTGSFHGRVVIANYPSAGISSVHVRTNPPTFDILTDSSGYFDFPGIPSGEYEIVASKAAFAPESTKTALRTGEKLTFDFSLNACPTVSATKILTKKIDQWWPNPVYSAEITATVSDQNGILDIDSVWFRVDSLTFPMTYSVTERNFQLTLNSYQVPSNNIEWLVGKPLTVVASDERFSIGTSSPFFVSRMIEDEAVPEYPVFQDTTSASPAFRWTPPAVRFFYSYTLNVVRQDAGSDVTIWTLENVGNYLSAYQYPATLEPGSYFWTVDVVDEYGNSSRSKESTFVVR